MRCAYSVVREQDTIFASLNLAQEKIQGILDQWERVNFLAVLCAELRCPVPSYGSRRSMEIRILALKWRTGRRLSASGGSRVMPAEVLKSDS